MIGPWNRRNSAVQASWCRSLACIATSGPVSAISIGALRELLAQDFLGAFEEIRCTVEQADEGEVPHRFVGQQRFRLRLRGLAGTGLPDAGAQQLLCDGTQRAPGEDQAGEA
jgi:hypothetical protein